MPQSLPQILNNSSIFQMFKSRSPLRLKTNSYPGISEKEKQVT